MPGLSRRVLRERPGGVLSSVYPTEAPTPRTPSSLNPPPVLAYDPATKALRAFYGASDRHKSTMLASASANVETVKALIGSPDSERPQEVYTPQAIRDFLVGMWGSIRLDPCSGPGSILNTERAYQGYQVDTGRVKKSGQPILTWAGEGLTSPWTDCTYFNPPYDSLEDWLAKAVEEAANGYEIVGLVPVRSHRKWWRSAVLGNADAVGWLGPVTFIGYDQSFPAPLALVYWGYQAHMFKFMLESAGLGDAEVRAHAD